MQPDQAFVVMAPAPLPAQHLQLLPSLSGALVLLGLVLLVVAYVELRRSL